VSGSGKSSVVFDTIATEAQRQLYENFSLFIRSFLPRYPQPEVDVIENLNMAVIVDQKRLGGGSHSTVGTITDIYTALVPGPPHSAFEIGDSGGTREPADHRGAGASCDDAAVRDYSKREMKVEHCAGTGAQA
jgi:hypothetical protein